VINACLHIYVHESKVVTHGNVLLDVGLGCLAGLVLGSGYEREPLTETNREQRISIAVLVGLDSAWVGSCESRRTQ
jgi:hypothetical protein